MFMAGKPKIMFLVVKREIIFFWPKTRFTLFGRIMFWWETQNMRDEKLSFKRENTESRSAIWTLYGGGKNNFGCNT